MPLKESSSAVVDLICEFIEAITHEILFRRRVYDPNIFERERLYGLALHKSRHPELNLYISDSIISLKEGIKDGRVCKVAICIVNAENRSIERYMVSFKVDEACDAASSKVENILRGCLLKLQYADACMKPLPKGCTFHFAAYATDLDAVPIDAWVEEDPISDSDGPSQLKSILPIKSGRAPAFRLQVHVES